LVIATGRYQTPSWPKIDGLEDFKGEILHITRYLSFRLTDASYKRPVRFHGKTVLIVGIGNSGIDAAVDLSNKIAKQVYVSGRGFYLYRIDLEADQDILAFMKVDP
jgi:cation diffusion facilitator CzcD-associated flavoprotein CzcO